MSADQMKRAAAKAKEQASKDKAKQKVPNGGCSASFIPIENKYDAMWCGRLLTLTELPCCGQER